VWGEAWQHDDYDIANQCGNSVRTIEKHYAPNVRFGSKPDIGGLVDRGPLWSGKQTFEAHVWILVMLTSASERKADLAA
jgi:hypothetical protein